MTPFDMALAASGQTLYRVVTARSAFTIEHDGLAASDLRSLRDLVLAIRQAERNDPLPPCAVAVAA